MFASLKKKKKKKFQVISFLFFFLLFALEKRRCRFTLTLFAVISLPLSYLLYEYMYLLALFGCSPIKYNVQLCSLRLLTITSSREVSCKRANKQTERSYSSCLVGRRMLHDIFRYEIYDLSNYVYTFFATRKSSHTQAHPSSPPYSMKYIG